MEAPSTIDWFEFGFECFQSAAILLGGLYALYEYRRFRRYGYKAQMDLDFSVYLIQGNRESQGDTQRRYVLDICATVKNVGNVRQKFPIIDFWANSIDPQRIAEQKQGPAENGDSDGKQQEKYKYTLKRSKLFRVDIAQKSPDLYYFVDSGVSQEFRHQEVIDQPGEYIEVVSRFFYVVPWRRYLWLRVMLPIRLMRVKNKHKKLLRMIENGDRKYCLAALEKKCNWYESRIERLKKFRVYEFHIATSLKRLKI